MITVNNFKVGVNNFPDNTQRLFGISTKNAGLFLSETYNISWFYENDSELATLMFIKRHLENFPSFHIKKTFNLYMPYIPNARMDRVKNDDEVFTLKYFCEFINSLNFDSVTVFDPHSDVSKALLNNLVVIYPNSIIDDAINDILSIEKDSFKFYIYFPDAGSMKRYGDYKCLEYFDFIYGEKERDWRTGEIKGLKIKDCNGNEIKEPNKNGDEKCVVLMIDDIISYGGTLVHSADKLRELFDIKSIYAYASHVENSIIEDNKNKMRDYLNNGIITKLYTTESIYRGGDTDNIKVLHNYAKY